MYPLDSAHLDKIFNYLDKNRDGLVSIEELQRLLDGIDISTNRDEFELLMGCRSLNYVDFVLFHDAMIKRGVFEQETSKHDRQNEMSLEKDLRKSFKVFDLDNDGFISCEELRVELSRLGLWDEGDVKVCRSMIDVYDTNADGLLDFEFKNMMLMTK